MNNDKYNLEFMELKDGSELNYVIERDYRIYDEEGEIIEIFAKTKNDVIVAVMTFIIYEKKEYKNLFFWEKVDDYLCKISLDKYEKDIGDICIVHGFTKIVDNIEDKDFFGYKYSIAKFYIRFCNYILKELNIFTYLEPMGTMFIDEELRKKTRLFINELKCDKNKLGEVYEKSVVSEKISQMYKFIEMENIFSFITGGKVFFSKSIYENDNS